MGKNLTLARKITIKDASGGPSKWFKKVVELAGDPLSLCRIAGTVYGTKSGVSDMGEFLRLQGAFIATNLLTGEQIRASSCILPNFVSDGIFAALKTDGANGVDFAIEVQVKFNESAVTKYEYAIVNLVETGTSDRMQKLLEDAGMSATVTALPSATPPEEKKQAAKK